MRNQSGSVVERCCAVCGLKHVVSRPENRAVFTPLQNFASAADFLLSFEIVASSVIDLERIDLCGRCLSSVLICDNVLSLFWRKVSALKYPTSQSSLPQNDPIVEEAPAASASCSDLRPPPVKRRKAAGRKKPTSNLSPCSSVLEPCASSDDANASKIAYPSSSRGEVSVTEIMAVDEIAPSAPRNLLLDLLTRAGRSGRKEVMESGKNPYSMVSASAAVHEVVRGGDPKPTGPGTSHSCRNQLLPEAASIEVTEDNAGSDGGDTWEMDSSGLNGDEDDDFNRTNPAEPPPKRQVRNFVHRTKISNCGVRLRICEDCGVGFATAMHFYRHFNRHHAKPDAFRCWECGRRFPTREELGNHEDAHWKEHFGNVMCIDCRKEIRATTVKMHVERAHGGRPNRTKAERQSSGRSYTPCFYCKYFSSSESQMELHVLQAHPGEGDGAALQCDECPKKFKDTHSLGKHKHIHRSETHACPHCPKTYKLRIGLRKHLWKHTGSLFGLCPECGRRFTKPHLANHMATVHGIGEVKFHECHLCPARYKSPKAYKIHLAAEHQIGNVKEKAKHSCDQCGKTYSLKKLYLAHMFREHGVRLPGFKEYPCVFCDRVCLSSNHYNAHMQKVHGQNSIVALKPLLCKLCSASCAERRQFMEHLKLVHDINAKGKNVYKEFLLES